MFFYLLLSLHMVLQVWVVAGAGATFPCPLPFSLIALQPPFSTKAVMVFIAAGDSGFLYCYR